jgi:hypothetical protein
MADLVVTAGSVALVTSGTAGQLTQTFPAVSLSAITAGQAVYRDPITGRVAPCLVTDATKSQVVGVAMNGAPGPNQPVTVAFAGDYTVGATIAAAVPITLGAAAGALTNTDADRITGWYANMVAVPLTTTVARLCVVNGSGTGVHA